MPNWCSNTLTISHPDTAMMERVVTGYNNNTFLNEFIPIPQELHETTKGWFGDHTYAQELNDFKESLNLKYFGSKNWYDFAVSSWGTKWDIGCGDGYDPIELNTTITFCFDSAWSPPIQAYEKLIEMGFSITAMYYEGGCMFCGIWEDGSDDYYDIQGNSEWVRSNIPSDIDEEFQIAEGMESWEEEEKEEAS